MKRDVWRRVGKRFLTRVAMPLAAVFLALIVLEFWTLRARAQAERARPRKPPIERRQDPAAPPQLGRDFTRSDPPAKSDWVRR
ncbi:MAG TPA: hypothetical protein VFG04_12360 [Planctomycetaceae bacterium]|jgi:hypothetical protein|nr:hypothetical protein [Planctomycetaceae bacterium]